MLLEIFTIEISKPGGIIKVFLFPFKHEMVLLETKPRNDLSVDVETYIK